MKIGEITLGKITAEDVKNVDLKAWEEYEKIQAQAMREFNIAEKKLNWPAPAQDTTSRVRFSTHFASGAGGR